MSGELYGTQTQVGKETTAGTAVAATRRMYLLDPKFGDAASVTPRRVATGGRDNVRAGTLGSAVIGGTASMDLDANEILEILLGSVKGGVTPTTPGGATNLRKWDFTPGDLDSQTWDWHDGFRGWEIAGVRIDGWTLTGNVQTGEATLTLTFLGMSMLQATITASLAQRTPTNIRGWEAEVAIDALGATPGTTELACTVTDYSVGYGNQMQRLYAANNSRAACAVNPGEIDVTMGLTVRANTAASLTEFNNFIAGVNRLVQLKLGHNRVIDAGVPNYEYVNITVPGFWTGVDLGGDSQGERAYVLSGSYVYDAVNAYGFKVEVGTARTAAY